MFEKRKTFLKWLPHVCPRWATFVTRLAFTILLCTGTLSAQDNPQPAILTATGTSQRAVIFPDAGTNPSNQILGSASFLIQPHGVAILDESRALVSDFSNSRINILNLSTGARLDGLVTTGFYNGTGTIAVSPDRRVMLAAGGNSTLYVFRAPFRLGTQASTITLPGQLDTPQTQAIVFDYAGRAFVNTRFGISVIDPPYTSISFTMPHNVLQTTTGALAISPDGQTLLLTRGTNAVRIYNAPFTPDSVPDVRVFPVNESIGLGGIMITPDGSTAITVNLGSYRAFFMHSPFTAISTIEDIPLPTEGNSGTFEDVGISADGKLAILTGNGTSADQPAVLVRAPFNAAETATSNLPILNVTNPSRGAGAVRFLPPGIAPGLKISATSLSSVASGQQLVYTLSYRNTGIVGVNNAMISAPVPPGTSFVSATDGGIVDNGSVSFPLGTIPAGNKELSVSFTVNVNAPPGNSLRQNNYTIAADDVVPIPGPPITTFVLGGLGCSTDMIGWWKGENAGNDIIGTNDGNPAGTLNYTTGVVGNAFDFTGGNGLNVPNAPELNPTDAFTIEFWASPKAPGSGTGDTTFVAKGNFNFPSVSQYAIRFNDQNQVIGRISDGTTFTDLVSPSPIPINQYSHIAMTKVGTDLRLYLNGSLVASAVLPTAAIAVSTSELTFARAVGASNAAVRIDEVSLYGRALSAAEIAAIAGTGAAGKCITPTSAPASISGRVLTPDGRGISNTRVIVTGMDGQLFTATTNSFGYYFVEGLQSGAAYTVTAAGKGLQFDTIIVNADQDLTDIDLVALAIEAGARGR